MCNFDINLSLSGSAIQSVMSSDDALTPGKTGGVGSAIFNLHDNGTLDYQVWICPQWGKFVWLFFMSIHNLEIYYMTALLK